MHEEDGKVHLLLNARHRLYLQPHSSQHPHSQHPHSQHTAATLTVNTLTVNTHTQSTPTHSQHPHSQHPHTVNTHTVNTQTDQEDGLDSTTFSRSLLRPQVVTENPRRHILDLIATALSQDPARV